MSGPHAYELREFDCGACERKFVALHGKVKILRPPGEPPYAVCDYCADVINNYRATLGLRPLWEGK